MKQGMKRYNLTLTQENVERYQALCKRCGLGIGTMSLACDDFIKEITDIMERATEGNVFSPGSFFRALGEKMAATMVGEEVKNDDKIGAKKKGARTAD